MHPTVYRQRLTIWGWAGALLFVTGPALFGWQLAEFLQPSGYGEPILLPLFATGLMPAVGAVLLLIGREYYDATEASAKEAAQVKAYYERKS